MSIRPAERQPLAVNYDAGKQTLGQTNLLKRYKESFNSKASLPGHSQMAPVSTVLPLVLARLHIRSWQTFLWLLPVVPHRSGTLGGVGLLSQNKIAMSK